MRTLTPFACRIALLGAALLVAPRPLLGAPAGPEPGLLQAEGEAPRKDTSAATVPVRIATPPRRTIPAAATPPARAATPQGRTVPAAAISLGSAPLLPPRPWFHASYFIDWGLALGVAGSGAAISLAAKPVTRSFRADDRRISLSKRPDTVPEWSIAFAAALPLAAAGIAQIWRPSGQDFHHAALGLAEGMALTFLLTNILKASVGRLRPDFLDRCQPDPQGQCTGEPDLVRRGRESFPSGHTSLFFAGGAYLSLYLWGKLKPFRSDGPLWKLLVILSPLVAASLVGVSRITDHRHHWEDVLVGALLGTGFAYLGYRLHYPNPWSLDAGAPRRRTRWVALPVVGPGSVGLAAQGEL